jgi:predicted transcriptional regulator
MDILRLIQNEGGKVKPTRILYGANLSHAALKEYLNSLEEKGLIEKVSENKHAYYRINQKGLEFVSEFRKIKKLTEAFGISI